MAILLDPRYKNLDFISDNSIKEKIHSTLQIEYNQLKLKISQQQNISSSSSSSITTTSTNIENLTPSIRSLHEYQIRYE